MITPESHTANSEQQYFDYILDFLKRFFKDYTYFNDITKYVPNGPIDPNDYENLASSNYLFVKWYLLEANDVLAIGPDCRGMIISLNINRGDLTLTILAENGEYRYLPIDDIEGLEPLGLISIYRFLWEAQQASRLPRQ